MRTLLVPLDGSALATAALPVAELLADGPGAEITLMRAVAWDSQPGQTREAAAYLDDVAANLRAPGLEVRTNVRIGEPANEIAELASERAADLIVMATHGRTGLGRAILGSVAERVLRNSPAPVVLLRPKAHPVGRLRVVLVPVDGRPGGALALATAVPLARASGARLILARVSVPAPLWLYEPTIGLNTGPLIDPMWFESARLAAQVYVDGLAARLRGAGVAAEGRAVLGEVAPALLHLAREVEADLIVMSTHARLGAARAVLGSVADAVVRGAVAPVLLVRRGKAPNQAGPEVSFTATPSAPGTAGRA